MKRRPEAVIEADERVHRDELGPASSPVEEEDPGVESKRGGSKNEEGFEKDQVTGQLMSGYSNRDRLPQLFYTMNIKGVVP